MYSSWADEAQRQIAAVMARLPDDATLDDRRRALRQQAHYFHGGTSWGKKVWPKQVRIYLEKHHGLPPRSPRNPRDVSERSPLFAKLNAPDIVFPYRKKDDAA